MNRCGYILIKVYLQNRCWAFLLATNIDQDMNGTPLNCCSYVTQVVLSNKLHKLSVLIAEKYPTLVVVYVGCSMNEVHTLSRLLF